LAGNAGQSWTALDRHHLPYTIVTLCAAAWRIPAVLVVGDTAAVTTPANGQAPGDGRARRFGGRVRGWLGLIGALGALLVVPTCPSRHASAAARPG
jgi:hypothetical protein